MPTPPKPPTRRPIPSPSTGGGGGTGGGTLTAAAEGMAAALAKPGRELNTVNNLDRNLVDLTAALRTLQQGLSRHTAVVQEGMPAERAVHEELGRMAQQLGQVAESSAQLRSDQRRRLAADHERIEQPRPNEVGYDKGRNTD
jgi:hypothetical protein